MRTIPIILGALIGMSTAACPALSTTQTEEKAVPDNNIQTFLRFVSMPSAPKRVTFVTVEAPGGRDWHLEAVVELASAKDRDACLGPAVSSPFSAEELQPPIRRALESRDEDLGEAYEPSPVAKSPLLHGWVRPVGASSLLMMLHTM